LVIENTSDKKAVFKGDSVTIQSLNSVGGISYFKEKQWRTIIHDVFDKNNTNINGWNLGVTSSCLNNTAILGGKCHISKKEIQRKIADLPDHTQIKIEVFFHFIGNWLGESGYLKVDGSRNSKNYLWTYRCVNKKQEISSNNICEYITCKMNHKISVTIPHNEKELKLAFGSSLTNIDPCDKSYGISDFQVMIK